MLQHYITSPIEEILTITAITVGIPTEVSRLYFGYSGNLREQVRSFEQLGLLLSRCIVKPGGTGSLLKSQIRSLK